MNKQLIVVFVAAMVCGALAGKLAPTEEVESQFAVFESDDVELGNLSEDRAMFADFCLASRDYVRQNAKSSLNNGVANLFELFSSELTSTMSKLAETEKVALGESQELIKQEGATRFLSGLKNVITALVNSVSGQVSAKFMNIIDMLNKDNAIQGVKDACTHLIDVLVPGANSLLETQKKDLLQSAEITDEQREIIGSTTLGNVGCVMTKRLDILTESCTNYMKITDEQFALIGLKPARH